MTRRIVLPTRGTLSFGNDKLTLDSLIRSQGINWSFEKLYVGWLTMTGVKTINEINEKTGQLREVHAYFAGNIWPWDNERENTRVQMSSEQLFSNFVRPEFCRGDLTPSYVQNSIEYSTDIFILFYPLPITRNTRQGAQTIVKLYPVGFLTGYKNIVDIGKGFYIDIVCVLPREKTGIFTQHAGNALIDLVEKIMYGIGINEIHLSALPTVLTFYPRLGYRHRQSCNTEPELENYEKGLQEKIISKNLPPTNELAIQDEDILDRMVELSLKEYGASKRPDCSPIKKIVNGVKIMKSKEEILNDLVNKECWVDGHRMTKCLPQERPSNYIYPYEHLLNVFSRSTKSQYDQ
jgi:hypothetical protein